MPPDPTPEEKQIAMYSLLHVYNQFPDPIDKIILAFVFELGYPQKFVALSLDKQEKTISARVKKIRTILTKSHRVYIKPEFRE